MTMENDRDSIDILAFGAHPDDVEIGMGGTLIKYAKRGFQVAICDLTKAELSSNGTVERRQAEAKAAGDILQLAERIQLPFPDRGLTGTKEQIDEIVSVIRTLRPKVLFMPAEKDRHPDHGNCSKLVKEAVFNAKIHKLKDRRNLPPWTVKKVYKYMINGFCEPDFYIDISDVFDKKMEALHAYASQFELSKDGVETPLTNGYVEAVASRDRLFGKEASVTYAEGFLKDTPIIIDNLIGEL